jgi:hypothetical protein
MVEKASSFWIQVRQILVSQNLFPSVTVQQSAGVGQATMFGARTLWRWLQQGLERGGLDLEQIRDPFDDHRALTGKFDARLRGLVTTEPTAHEPAGNLGALTSHRS